MCIASESGLHLEWLCVLRLDYRDTGRLHWLVNFCSGKQSLHCPQRQGAYHVFQDTLLSGEVEVQSHAPQNAFERE